MGQITIRDEAAEHAEISGAVCGVGGEGLADCRAALAMPLMKASRRSSARLKSVDRR
jgi:hypothetical protein